MTRSYRSLCWKHWKFYRTHFFTTLLIIFLPTFMTILLLIIKETTGDNDSVTRAAIVPGAALKFPTFETYVDQYYTSPTCSDPTPPSVLLFGSYAYSKSRANPFVVCRSACPGPRSPVDMCQFGSLAVAGDQTQVREWEGQCRCRHYGAISNFTNTSSFTRHR